MIPRATTADQVRIDHLHIDPRPASQDLDCILPLRRLDELVAAGVVGASAPSHYSIVSLRQPCLTPAGGTRSFVGSFERWSDVDGSTPSGSDTESQPGVARPRALAPSAAAW